MTTTQKEKDLLKRIAATKEPRVKFVAISNNSTGQVVAIDDVGRAWRTYQEGVSGVNLAWVPWIQLPEPPIRRGS